MLIDDCDDAMLYSDSDRTSCCNVVLQWLWRMRNNENEKSQILLLFLWVQKADVVKTEMVLIVIEWTRRAAASGVHVNRCGRC